MSGRTYHSFSIPADALARLRQLSQLQQGSNAFQSRIADRYGVLIDSGAESDNAYDEAKKRAFKSEARQ